MSDLISREAVMKLIESKCTDGCLGTEDTTLIDAHGLIDDVSDIPTAYDVEKVVAELEEASYQETVDDMDPFGDMPRVVVSLEKAKAVVRKGGAE